MHHVIVENNGMENEIEVKEFKSFGECARYVDLRYSDEEKRSMHVVIKSYLDNGEVHIIG